MAVTSQSANSLKEILFNLKMQLKNKGLTSSKNLLKNFLIADLDKSGFLDREEFEKLLQKSGIFLSRMDITYLMRAFDKNKDGKISFLELKEALIPDLCENRRVCVENAWEQLSRGSQTVTMQKLYSSFNIRNHPQVASGEKAESEILNKFLEVFDVDLKGPDGVVTKGEFLEVYKGISASYPIDEKAFTRMIECVWGVSESRQCGASEIAQLETMIKEKIRLRMNPTETEEKALIKVFKFVDLDNNQVVNPYEFSEALLRIGVILSPYQLEVLFNKYDSDCSGGLDYSEFSKAVGGNNSHLFKKSTSHTFYN